MAVGVVVGVVESFSAGGGRIVSYASLRPLASTTTHDYRVSQEYNVARERTTRSCHCGMAFLRAEKFMETTGYIVVTFKLYREDDQYVARCEELGISTCAKTIEKAAKRIEEATTLYLNTLDDEGERERVFLEAGITI